jgi:hypothetical protein
MTTAERLARRPLGIGGFDRSVWSGWLPLDFEVRLEQLGFPIRPLAELLIEKPALAHVPTLIPFYTLASANRSGARFSPPAWPVGGVYTSVRLGPAKLDILKEKQTRQGRCLTFMQQSLPAGRVDFEDER